MIGSIPLTESLTTRLSPLGSEVSPPGSSAALSKPGGASGQHDFAAMLADLARESVQTVANGEATALAGIEGKASVQQVVQAVMQAEQTVSAMVAIRDKVVGAYLEISRMQI